MARVFVIEPPTVNIEPARAWGDIVVLFPQGSGVSPLDSDVYAGRVIEELERVHFNTRQDRLLIVGPLIGTVLVCAALVTRFKAFKGLLYNPVKNEYVLRTVGRWQYIEKYRKGGNVKSKRAS